MELQVVVSCSLWVLRTGFQASARTVHTFSHRAVFPATGMAFFFFFQRIQRSVPRWLWQVCTSRPLCLVRSWALFQDQWDTTGSFKPKLTCSDLCFRVTQVLLQRTDHWRTRMDVLFVYCYKTTPKTPYLKIATLVFSTPCGSGMVGRTQAVYDRFTGSQLTWLWEEGSLSR